MWGNLVCESVFEFAPCSFQGGWFVSGRLGRCALFVSYLARVLIRRVKKVYSVWGCNKKAIFCDADSDNLVLIGRFQWTLVPGGDSVVGISRSIRLSVHYKVNDVGSGLINI